jgi:hypothetical protein
LHFGGKALEFLAPRQVIKAALSGVGYKMEPLMGSGVAVAPYSLQVCIPEIVSNFSCLYFFMSFVYFLRLAVFVDY